MSVYDSSDFSGNLYGSMPVDVGPVPPAASAPPEPSAADGVGAALEIIASPASLLSEVLPPNPADSKLPYGLAILGACVFAVLLAASFDKKGA